MNGIRSRTSTENQWDGGEQSHEPADKMGDCTTWVFWFKFHNITFLSEIYTGYEVSNDNT